MNAAVLQNQTTSCQSVNWYQTEVLQDRQICEQNHGFAIALHRARSTRRKGVDYLADQSSSTGSSEAMETQRWFTHFSRPYLYLYVHDF